MSVPLSTTVRVLMDGDPLIESVTLGTILLFRGVGYSERATIRRDLAEFGSAHISDDGERPEYVLEVVK